MVDHPNSSAMGVFSSAKDRMVETMALQYANASLLAPYGRATSLKLDSSMKNLDLEVELRGETSPVQLQIRGYEIKESGGRYFATAREVHTSREWLTRLAADRLANQQFEIPANVGSMLMKYL